MGLALTAVIASTISEKREGRGKAEELVLLEGYQAAWWFILGITGLTILVSLWGVEGDWEVGVEEGVRY